MIISNGSGPARTMGAKAARVTRRMSFAICAAFSFAGAFGQSQTAIRGVVTDPVGVIFPGTAVTIVNEKTGKSVKLLSDDMGRYLARDLEKGTYRIQATQLGFRPFIKTHIHLEDKCEVVVDIPLKLGPPRKRVIVRAFSPK